jgi:tetratricopeptide (TPR) repeat protein
VDNDNNLRIAELLQEALKLDPSQAFLWQELAARLCKAKHFEEAITAFKKAISLEPASPVHHYNLGDAYLAAGKPTEAIAPLLHAVAHDSEYSLAYYDLSLAYFKIAEYEQGAAAAKAALKRYVKDTQSFNIGIGATNNLALCLLKLGKPDEALASIQSNLTLFASTYFNIGIVLFKMHRFEEAAINFQKALDIEPNDAEYLDMLGNTYSHLGKLMKAKIVLEKAIFANPNYSYAFYDLGTVLAKINGEQDKALQHFHRAIELDPELNWAYYGAACIQAVSGNKQSALSYLEQALEKGLRDFKHVEQDSDLDSLRSEPAFHSLMKKYIQ